MDAHETAAEVCRLAGAPSLLAWLELPETTDGAAAREALHARRRRLQGMQANPKHGAMAKLVITRFQVLEAVLDDPKAYLAALEQARVRAQLPLLDMGVDGVLADGAVTDEEHAFLHQVASGLGIDPALASGRLKARADAQGIALGARPAEGAALALGEPSHPWLPAGWWGDLACRWLASQVPQTARRVVELGCGEGAVAAALLSLRPELVYVGFDVPSRVARAEARLEAEGLDGATVLPLVPPSLPLGDASADTVLLVLQRPSPTARAEARRVAGPEGQVVEVTVGAPRLLGVPALDAPLEALAEALAAAPPGPVRSASTFVATRTVVARAEAVALVERRLAAVQQAGVSPSHPAMVSAGHALAGVSEGPDGVLTWAAPLVARISGPRPS